MEKAVIDRIVDKTTAVILVGINEKEYHFPANKLPQGAREGTWLRVETDDDQILSLEIDNVETKNVSSRIQEKMDRLRQRGRNPS